MSSQASENDSASSNPSGATSIFPYNYSSYSPPVASPPFAHLAADSQQAAAESLRAFLCSSGAAAGNGDFNGVATSEDAGTGLCGGLTSSSSSSSSPSSYAQTGALSSVCAPPPGIVSAARCSIEQLTEKAEKPGDASAPADDGSSSLETPANAGVSEHAKSPAVPSSLSSPSCLPPPSSNDPTGSADGTAGGISHSTKEDGDSCQQQVPSCEGGPNGAALGDSFRVLSRKRKADAFLPDGDAETMERLKRLMESLTREQMKLLLAKACVQYPAVEMALNSMIEADPASRRLLIRNVGFNTTEETLYKSLETYGEIDDFKLVCDRQSGLSRGFAFVTYRTMESVQRILNEHVVVQGRTLVVKLAAPQDAPNASKRAYPGMPSSCRLFVRNVPDSCDNDRLREEFSVFGEIREAVIIRAKDGKSKGYGFVVFEEPDALLKATRQSQRIIDGQVTFVSVASDAPTRRRGDPMQNSPSCGPPLAGGGSSGWPVGMGMEGPPAYMPNVVPPLPAPNAYMQQMAAMNPALYLQQYQQQYLAASQMSAAVAAITGQSGGTHPLLAAAQALGQAQQSLSDSTQSLQ